MDSGDYILIADCHIRAHSDAEGDFFEMLDRIDAVNPKGVIFLGDIFELWIALKGYESFGHAQFVEWCSEHKKRFEIGFIEGNHEFYVSETHRDAFSWIDDVSHTLDNGVQFIHGDLINRDDRRYLLLRRLIRNPFTRFLLCRDRSNGCSPGIFTVAKPLLCRAVFPRKFCRRGNGTARLLCWTDSSARAAVSGKNC